MAEDNGTREQIGKLVQLQELDSEIFDIRSRKESFPGKVKEMDDSLDDKKGGMENAEEELKKLQVTKGGKETDMQVKEEQVKKYESDLYQIKNNKEYTALQQEINSIKADISLLEENIINLFDEIEAAQKKSEDEKKIFEEEKQKVEKEKAVIEDEEKKLSACLDELTAKRAEAAKEISPDFLEQYERILKSRGRVGLTPVNGEFCGGCNMQLRPQIINEAKLRKTLVFCENCCRMLYAEE